MGNTGNYEREGRRQRRGESETEREEKKEGKKPKTQLTVSYLKITKANVLVLIIF